MGGPDPEDVIMRRPANKPARRTAANPAQARPTPRPRRRQPTGSRLEDVGLRGLVGYNIRRADVRMNAHFLRAMVEYGIRPADFSALTLIAANTGITPGDIGEALSIKRSNMVGLVDRLEHRGLVERAVSEWDRRSQVLTLTRKGAVLTTELQTTIAEMDRHVTDCWTAAEREQVIRLLQRLYRRE